MKLNWTIALSALALAACGEPATEETAPSTELEYMAPEAEPVRVGYAGEDPANIARYLLASGAQGASLSPDGTTIAFRYNVTGRPQIWTVPAIGGQPQQLTFGNGVTFFRWAPDGSEIVYGADNDGNEQESYYAISMVDTSERLLMPAVEGGFRRFGDFSADGTQFAYSSTERNGLDFDIYLGDTETGESRRIYEGKYGFAVRGISPDASQLVIAETVGEDSDNLYLLEAETGERTTISAPEPRANHADAGIAWQTDGSGFYFASNLNGEFAALMRYDFEVAAFETLFEADGDVETVRLCGPDDQYLAWSVNDDGYSRLYVQDLTTGSRLNTPNLAEGVYGLSCGADTTRLVIGISGWNTPGDLVVWDLATDDRFTAFTSNLAGLDPKRLIRPESIRMTASDGVELQGLLYLPDENSRAGDGPPPVLFNVHGGPTGQSRPSFDGVAQYHLDRGIAVFEPNVRGSTGFGRTYVTLDDKTKRLDSVRDLIDMLAALKEDGRVDTERAVVKGGSYGGYMVNAVLANYPDSFSAGVSLFGVGDWVTALEIASPALKASDIIEYGDINDQEWRDFYTENSPIRQADQIKAPVLYSHGVMDPRIDIAETEVMVKALRENGIEAPFIRIPDEGHGWRKLSNRLYYYRKEAEFLTEQFETSD